MQTKHQIQVLLAAGGLSPSKRLGQNFLIDLNLMRLLIDSAQIKENDVVLEVGCGAGSLTQGLAEKAGKVVAVELHDELASIAQSELKDLNNVTIINSDILENKSTISPVVTEALKQGKEKFKGRVLLVANLPYNVASSVIINLITGETVVDNMYVTVQKEVAERITAEPDCKEYGVISVLLSAAGEVKIIRVLKPSVFWPRPQVDSAMVSFVRNEQKISRIKNTALFREVINLFMGHRRKTVAGCTKFAGGRLVEIDNWPEIFAKCAINPKDRPDKLSPEQYIDMSNICCKGLSTGQV